MLSDYTFCDLPEVAPQNTLDGQNLDFGQSATDFTFCDLPELGSQDTIDGQNLDLSESFSV
jgi:hypothetical protein